MRRIGTLPSQSQAAVFCDYLTTIKIDAHSEKGEVDSQDVWEIWIREEQHVSQAKDELASFRDHPEDAKYKVEEEAKRIRTQRIADANRKLKYQQQYRPKRTPSPRDPLSHASLRQSNFPITLGVIIISCFLHFSDLFEGSRKAGEQSLRQYFVTKLSFVDMNEWIVSGGDAYASLREGEVWRIVTPMLLHGDAFHLAFNMMWLYVLGSAIERLHGSFFFLIVLLLSQIAGTMLQVSLPPEHELPAFLSSLAGSPHAIGASGAVYGLFGYLWIRPLLDPNYPIHMVPGNVLIMIGWLFLCMTPMIKNVANGAHVGGLLAGMLIAYLSTLMLSRGNSQSGST